MNATKMEGIWHIDDNDAEPETNLKYIEQLEHQVEYLENALQQANETIADMTQRHDTIVMQLTKQLEQQTLLIEDMRDRSLWRRVKTALGFASP